MDYLIKNTSEEERKKLVNKALAVSLSGAKKPSKETLKLAKEYIDGKKELNDITKEIINKYHNTKEEY